MAKVYIDETLVAQGVSGVSLGFDVAEMSGVESSREAYDVVVEVVRSAMNVGVFGGEGFLHAPSRFNAENHWATITYEGEVVIEGNVVMVGIAHRDDDTIYKLRVRRAGADWAHNVSVTMLKDSDVPFSLYMTVMGLKALWDVDSPVEFVPVYRDCYIDNNRSLTQENIVVPRTICDYFPFLSIRHVVESMFATTSFDVVSRFMDGEMFKSLFMSGAYASQNNFMARDAMNFFVEKVNDVATTASTFGRVYLSSAMSLNSVGNLVDVESLSMSDGCFSRNNCFRLDDSGGLIFAPTTQVCVGFEVRLQFVGDYVIESRTKLKTFDTVYMYDGNLISIDVLNTNEDLRSSAVAANFGYSPIVFDGGATDSYRLVASIGGAASKSVVGEWSGRMGHITTPNVAAGAIGELELQVLSGGAYVACASDWALYYGVVEERGEVQLDFTLYSSPKSVTPDTPISFNTMFIQGAEQGSRFKLLKGSSIKPTFASYPGEAKWVAFEDVAQHPYRQADLLEALQQMFNLRFYIDHLARRVYIDPEEWLYDQQQTWDWSDRIIVDGGALFEDRALELHRGRMWGYQQGDGLINRYKTDYWVPGTQLPARPVEYPVQSVEGAVSQQFGEWRVALDSAAALQSVESRRNRIFSPSLNSVDGLLIVGDRDDEASVDSFDFAPRIVMDAGETVSRDEEVPHFIFHSSDETLCFEDRDGATGLNSYYRDDVARGAEAQYVTLDMRLSTHDIVMLLSPTEGAPSIFSTFRLLIDGEWALCRLVSMGDYELGSDRARCKFLIVG